MEVDSNFHTESLRTTERDDRAHQFLIGLANGNHYRRRRRGLWLGYSNHSRNIPEKLALALIKDLEKIPSSNINPSWTQECLNESLKLRNPTETTYQSHFTTRSRSRSQPYWPHHVSNQFSVSLRNLYFLFRQSIWTDFLQFLIQLAGTEENSTQWGTRVEPGRDLSEKGNAVVLLRSMELVPKHGLSGKGSVGASLVCLRIVPRSCRWTSSSISTFTNLGWSWRLFAGYRYKLRIQSWA